jgi:hypothetical protein
MSKRKAYQATLRALDDWEPFILAESGLPGPRGNLELVQAVAEEGDEAQFQRWVALDPVEAPVESPQVVLVMAGLVGLGRLLAEGRGDVRGILRRYAGDPRWRVREGVAMALQRWGDAAMDELLPAMEDWSRGNRLEQRAAVAALCEPRLLRQERRALAVLQVLDVVTGAIVDAPDRRSDEYRVLRQALGYGWSVAVVAAPEQGKGMMERWLANPDPDVRWVMRENLKKNRLVKMDSEWVARWKEL